MNWVWHDSSVTFETKLSYCHVARQSLRCYTAVARLGFKKRCYCRAKVKFNFINLVQHGSSMTFETGLIKIGSSNNFALAWNKSLKFFKLDFVC